MSLKTLKEEKASLSHIQNEHKRISDELESLMQIPEVVRYIELSKKEDELSKKARDTADRMFWLNIESCNHLMVYIGGDYDGYEGRHYPKYFCLKCRLTNAYEDLGSSSAYGEYFSKMNDMWRHYGFYSVRNHLIPLNTLRCDGILDVEQLSKQCNEMVETHPKITNQELIAQILLKVKGREKR